MKITLLTILLAFTSLTYAGCEEDFNNGLNEYNFAARYFDNGIASYNAAVELSRTSNPDFLAVCNLLVDSVTGFSVATSSYTNCSLEFAKATGSCGGADSAQAASNKEVCLNNLNIANDNQTTLRRLLKNTCYVSSKKLDILKLKEINMTLE